MAAINRNADIFDPQPLDIAGNANRHDDPVNRHRLFLIVGQLKRHLDRILFQRHRRHRRPGMQRHPLLLEGLRSQGRNFCVFNRQNPVEHFDNRDLSPQRAVKACKFNTDRP